MASFAFNESLIEAVRRRPVLYDKSADHYYNRAHVNKEWRNIAQELGVDVQTVRKKWTALRDYFQRNHRLMMGSEEELSETKKWYLYDSLLFLLPHLSKRLNLGDSDDEGTGEDWHSNRNESSSSHAENATSTTCFRDIPLPPAPRQKKSKSRKRRFHEDEPGSNSLDGSMWETFSPDWPTGGESYVNVDTSVDEDELFCKSLVSKIRGLDPFSKIECQAEVQLVILKFMRRSAESAANQSQSFVESNEREQNHPNLAEDTIKSG